MSASASSGPSSESALLSQLPRGTTPRQVTYLLKRSAPAAPAGQTVLAELPLGACAVEGPVAPDQKIAAAGTLTLLLVPLDAAASAAPADSPALGPMRSWVELAAGSPAACQLMTFQNAQLCWGPGRCAILATADRLEPLAVAVAEVTYFEAELRSIESDLAAKWPQLEADMPLAFEFQEASVPTRKVLRSRFQEVLLLRARLARLGAHVNAPHKHPPTLATQISERLRERTQMAHRYEFIDEELSVFEEVYEMCGQRASDFMLTRSGNILEWIIIILLAAQILMSGFEILSSHTPTTTSSSTLTNANTVPAPAIEAEPPASETTTTSGQ